MRNQYSFKNISISHFVSILMGMEWSPPGGPNPTYCVEKLGDDRSTRFSRVLLPLTDAHERFVDRSERSIFCEGFVSGEFFNTIDPQLPVIVPRLECPLARAAAVPFSALSGR